MRKFGTPFSSAIFVCTQKRPDGHPKPCCANSGGMALRMELKEMVQSKGMDDGVKVFTSGCLGACEHGPVAVRYPDGEYLLGVTPDDLPEILEDLAKD